MEIRDAYQKKGAEKATALELKDRYESQGFTAYEEYRIGDYTCDLYVEKGDVKIAFEIKSSRLNANARAFLDKEREFLKSQGVHFRVVIVPRPVLKQIEVEGIEQSILDAFLLDLPSDLDELSSHTLPQEVDEVSISRIKLYEDGNIEINGSSDVTVDLEYGSRSDNVLFTEVFPFKFKGFWKYDEAGKLTFQKFTEIIFDTSSFDK